MPNRDRTAIIVATLSAHPLPPSDAPRLVRLIAHFKLPCYYALSYVWGEGSALDKTHKILLDGCPFSITAKENLDEKDGQLSIMREIHHLATVVLVPLGFDLTEGVRMMRFVQNLTQRPRTIRVIAWFMDIYAADEDEKKEGRSKTLYESMWADAVWKGYEWLMNIIMCFLWPLMTFVDVFMNVSADDPQFRNSGNALRFDRDKQGHGLKAWSPSEACLRTVKEEDHGEIARLLETNLVFESRYFNRIWTLQEGVTGRSVLFQYGGIQVSLNNVLRTLYYLKAEQGLEDLDQTTMDTIETLWLIKNAWQRGVRLNIRELLFHCRRRDCKDNKDMVYGLLGLIDGRTHPRLQPDKNKSVGEVYADTTRFIIDSERCLDVICCPGWKERPEDLPSWSPHLCHFGTSDEMAHLIDSSGRTTMFSASGKEPYVPTKAEARDRQFNQILTVTGLLIGTVQHLSQKPEVRDSLGATKRKWTTANAGSQTASRTASLDLLHRVLKDEMEGRRLVLLQEGSMASVPANAPISDAIFVLLGCSVPVYVRKDENTDKWRVIGDCYVIGFMGGEAIHQRDVGQLVEQKIMLV